MLLGPSRDGVAVPHAVGHTGPGHLAPLHVSRCAFLTPLTVMRPWDSSPGSVEDLVAVWPLGWILTLPHFPGPTALRVGSGSPQVSGAADLASPTQWHTAPAQRTVTVLLSLCLRVAFQDSAPSPPKTSPCLPRSLSHPASALGPRLCSHGESTKSDPKAGEASWSLLTWCSDRRHSQSWDEAVQTPRCRLKCPPPLNLSQDDGSSQRDGTARLGPAGWPEAHPIVAGGHSLGNQCWPLGAIHSSCATWSHGSQKCQRCGGQGTAPGDSDPARGSVISSLCEALPRRDIGPHLPHKQGSVPVSPRPGRPQPPSVPRGPSVVGNQSQPAMEVSVMRVPSTVPTPSCLLPVGVHSCPAVSPPPLVFSFQAFVSKGYPLGHYPCPNTERPSPSPLVLK